MFPSFSGPSTTALFQVIPLGPKMVRQVLERKKVPTDVYVHVKLCLYGFLLYIYIHISLSLFIYYMIIYSVYINE